MFQAHTPLLGSGDKHVSFILMNICYVVQFKFLNRKLLLFYEVPTDACHARPGSPVSPAITHSPWLASFCFIFALNIVQ